MFFRFFAVCFSFFSLSNGGRGSQVGGGRHLCGGSGGGGIDWRLRQWLRETNLSVSAVSDDSDFLGHFQWSSDMFGRLWIPLALAKVSAIPVLRKV